MFYVYSVYLDCNNPDLRIIGPKCDMSCQHPPPLIQLRIRNSQGFCLEFLNFLGHPRHKTRQRCWSAYKTRPKTRQTNPRQTQDKTNTRNSCLGFCLGWPMTRVSCIFLVLGLSWVTLSCLGSCLGLGLWRLSCLGLVMGLSWVFGQRIKISC